MALYIVVKLCLALIPPLEFKRQISVTSLLDGIMGISKLACPRYYSWCCFVPPQYSRSLCFPILLSGPNAHVQKYVFNPWFSSFYKSTYQISMAIPISSASKIHSLLLISTVPLKVSTTLPHLPWDWILYWWMMNQRLKKCSRLTYAWSVIQGQYDSQLMEDT